VRSRKRWLLGGVSFIAAAALLTAGWWTVRLSRARAAWESYRSEAAARGVRLTLLDFLPPQIKPEENYANVAIFQEARSSPDEAGKRLKLPQITSPSASEGADVLVKARDSMVQAGWLSADANSKEPAAAVLEGMSRFESEFAELRQARARSRAWFGTGAKQPPLTEFSHLLVAQSVSAMLVLQMEAHLALDQSAEALENFRDAARLIVALQDQPTLISHLVRVACWAQLHRAIDRAVTARKWPAEDLWTIKKHFSKLNLLDPCSFPWSPNADFSTTAKCGSAGNLCRSVSTTSSSMTSPAKSRAGGAYGCARWITPGTTVISSKAIACSMSV
jgi:hypothetical protein